MGILTFKDKKFYMDGEEFVVISGAMHYFRIPREYWHDRLLKLRECGFNCVETYTCWNLHERREGEFDFSGMLDLAEYVKEAENVGLYVILRPGPYICAEWEFGGLPSWLLNYEDMELRCNDPVYLSKVKRYYDELLERLRPHFASNGGNIVMLQVENEYGSYGDDKDYLRAILNIYKEKGIDCLFFTSDGPSYSMLSGGTLDECLSVANFGSNPAYAAGIMDKFRPDEPFMCGEYWCGWFDHWGEVHHVRAPEDITGEFRTFLQNDWSINVYMFHGGTNFNFWNGANHGGKYEPTITSYDYNAPLNEAGDRTAAYYMFRDAMVEKYGDKVPPLTANETPKAAYGKVKMTESAKLFDNLDKLSSPIHSLAPLSMEKAGQDFGYILYSYTIKGPRTGGDWKLWIDKVADRAQIFINGEHKGTYERWTEIPKEERVQEPALGFGETARLDILVENMGRVNYGPMLRDKKGLFGVHFGNQHHYGWDNYPLPMDNLDVLEYKTVEESEIAGPTFLRGYLDIEGEPADTFIRLDGFKKGFVVVNGFNIGRYFNLAGPQRTLYVPAPMLKSGKNEIVVFESDGTDTLAVEFFDKPDLG